MTGFVDNANPSNDSGENITRDNVSTSLPETVPQSLTLSGLIGETEMQAQPTILNKDGSVKKKPGRKPGQKNAVTPPVEGEETMQATMSPTAPKTPQAKKAVRLGCDQTARAILGTTVGALREFIGPEWDFTSQEEADGMRIALAAYIESKGGGEMSPEVAMLLVSCGYIAPRFKHENTRSKVGGFFKSSWDAIRDVFRR
jgi:hypothetical protein